MTTDETTDMPEGKTSVRSSYHHGDLKSALLGAARALLERDGPELVSFRAIARAAGVSRAAPYHHFHNKEDLLARLAGTGFQELGTAQERTATTATAGRERIAALGFDYVRFAMTNRQLYRLMFGVGISNWGAHPAVLEFKSAAFRPVQAALAHYLGEADGGDRGLLEDSATAAWALVHGLSMLIIDGSLAQTPEETSRIKRVLMGYVDGLRQR